MCDSPPTECARRIAPICQWREQATVEWPRRVISIVVCCHSVKLCALAAPVFRSQQNGALTKIWRQRQVQPFIYKKERAVGVVGWKKGWIFLQPLDWRCVECAIHHERDVCEEEHACEWREQVIIEWSRIHGMLSLLFRTSQCEALRTCCSGSGFPIASSKYRLVLVACRGLVVPGATAWLYPAYKILELSSGVWWSLLLDIRCLWRHNMMSYSRLQTNVLAKFVDTSRGCS